MAKDSPDLLFRLLTSPSVASEDAAALGTVCEAAEAIGLVVRPILFLW